MKNPQILYTVLGAVPTINLTNQVSEGVKVVSLTDVLTTETMAVDPLPLNHPKPVKRPKVTKEKLAQLPLDIEVEGNTILAESKEYFLSLAQTDSKEDEVMEGLIDADEDLISDERPDVSKMTDKQKVTLLSAQLDTAYKKNAAMVRKNKSLRLQLYAASKKTLSQKAKLEIAKEVLTPFFTAAQIDCFCRPDWLRSRNWQDEDFEIALSLRKLMSKKAFSFLRKKRLVPMPSLTSLRKYNKMKGIVLQHSNSRYQSVGKPTVKKPATDPTTSQPAKKRKTKKVVAARPTQIQQPQTLLYEQISGLDPNTPQYIVVENSGKDDKGQTQYVTLGNDLMQHVQPNVEFLQQDEATGQVIATIMTDGGATSGGVQMVTVDGVQQGQFATIVQASGDQEIVTANPADVGNIVTLEQGDEANKEAAKLESKEHLSFIQIGP